MRSALPFLLLPLAFVANLCAAFQDPSLALRTWTVAGVARTALVYIPQTATTQPTPVVFIFHGHGGNSKSMAANRPFPALWPEAISIYPQGLPTPGQLTDPAGQFTGWQKTVGDEGDRDLKFFDAMLASLRKDYKVDDQRIYVTGHSNGGGFTYLLWFARGDVFAAVAPTSAAFRDVMKLSPKPYFMAGGTNDPLVKFQWQQGMIDAITSINQCGPGVVQSDKLETLYPSKIGCPIETYIHPGGHPVPPEVAPAIAKFFQAQVKP